MLGPNRSVDPRPGEYYDFGGGRGDVSFPFYLYLDGYADADEVVTVRDDHHGWTDISGYRGTDGWTFSLPFDDYYEPGSSGLPSCRFKFVRNGAYQLGPDLLLGYAPYPLGTLQGARIRVAGVYVYTWSTVQFP
jgi:hypothetical protein